jgi:hypothetical protein
MKNPLLFVLTLFIGLCMMTTTSVAQFSMKVGPITGLNFNIGTGSDVPQTATGLGLMIGGEADMSFSPTVGLITRLVFYDNMSASWSESVSDGIPNHTRENSGSIAYFTIDALFKLQLQKSNFYFFAGPSFGINLEGSYEYTEKATGYQDFKDKGTMKDMSARFALKVGAGYNISVGRNLEIAPNASFSFGLTKIQSNVSSRLMNIFVGATLKFHVI